MNIEAKIKTFSGKDCRGFYFAKTPSDLLKSILKKLKMGRKNVRHKQW